MLPLLSVVTGWLLFLSLAATLGVVVGHWVVLPQELEVGGVSAPELRTAAARLGRSAAAVLLGALGLVFVRQLLEFHDPYAPWGADLRILLLGTDWGTAWLVAVPVALLGQASFWMAAGGQRGPWWSASVAILALGAFPAFTGHANSGDFRAFTLVADTLHVWAVGGWIGGLALVLVLERRHGSGRGHGSPSLLPVLVPRFSPVAVSCVATLVGTGVFAAWVHLESVGALFRTHYGQLILLKVGLVLCVLALGALNWRRLTPRLGETGGRDALRRAATIEFLFANLVLLVTAVLVRTSPM